MAEEEPKKSGPIKKLIKRTIIRSIFG